MQAATAAAHAALAPRTRELVVRSCAAEGRIAELEALATKLALDKAEIACELAEERRNARSLEERLSERTMQKDAAEDLASRLLAQKLQAQGDGGKAENADGEWPPLDRAPPPPPGCMWGVEAEEGEEEDKAGASPPPESVRPTAMQRIV